MATMSFEEGRDGPDTLQTTPTRPLHDSVKPHEENELPLPPKSEPQTPKAEIDSETRERLEHVLHSDIGVSTLLNRLKQSISSARDFAAFLKERSSVEEKHAQGIRKLSRSTHEIIRRPESKGGSFASNFEELTKVHDRMADNGLQFARDTHQMHDEIQDLLAKCERERKTVKSTNAEAEKVVQDLENAMSKAKSKYYTLAEQLDGVRTGERASGKFGRRKDEDELRRRLDAADGDYAQKVQQAQNSRRDLHSRNRPQTVKSLQNLIRECDAGLGMQMQKYTSLTEKLLLGNGLCVSPLKDQASGSGVGPKSMRDLAYNINDQKDFHDYVLGFTNKAGSRPPEIKYEQHPSLAPKQQQPTQSQPTSNFDNAPPQFGTPERQNTSNPYERGHRPEGSGQISGVMPFQPQSPDRQFSGPPPAQYQSGPPPAGTYGTSQAPQLPHIGSPSDPSDRPDIGSDSRDSAIQRSGAPMGPGFGRQDHYSLNGPSEYNQAGPSSVGRGGPLGGGFGQDSRGPSVGSATMPESSHGLGSRGPSFGVIGNQGPGFGSDNRGPSIGGSGQSDNRGPSFGHQSDPVGAGRGAPYSQQPFQSQRDRFDQRGPSISSQGPPALGQDPSAGPPGGFRGPPQPSGGTGPGAVTSPTMSLPSQQRRADMQRQNLPPLKPVFGIPLDELFRRDGSAVPHIIFRCIEAVDLHGLDTEGIYRIPGSAPVIMELKAQFDHDASQIDMRNPAAYKNDIAAVTTLLKHFLRDLPDPLLTSAAYSQFIQAAQIDDDHMRRDSLHAIINSLPDPNYATLRVLALHLNRVAQHADRNRMTSQNLAIVLGPTFMGVSGKDAIGEAKDAGWQSRVIETILKNTMQIFDDDE